MRLRTQRRRVLAAGAVMALAAVPLLASGCYSPALLASRGGLDSLRVRVDTLMVRDSVAYALLLDTRHELDAQRDMLLSTRASTGSTSQEVFGSDARIWAPGSMKSWGASTGSNYTALRQ